MAYRRRQGNIHRSPNDGDATSTSAAANSSSSLVSQAIRASAAHRDSSLSPAYASSGLHSIKDRSKVSATYDYTSMGSTNEPGGFWGGLARKAKSILDDDKAPRSFDARSSIKTETVSTSNQVEHRYESFENSRKLDSPKLRKGLDRITSSLNQIGGTIGNALEEGRTIVDKKTQDIIQETRKLQNRRKGTNDEQNQLQELKMQSAQQQTDQEYQLKASRDVAVATAAKAKLLLRELKTVKADFAFAKERCSQLEEENKMLREALEKGDHPTDDDMIRLQLESLLAEKARLANENSEYARENRFLREIVEYHQLSMQDVVYLDEGIEEVTEVNPELSKTLSFSASPPLPSSPHEPLERTTSQSP
ncbi:hypothetical protein QVD17_02970 [Tagetes erecta]|uniref:Uncharacterized protein n=1 Tax=Tagetes erecta TaxID=13708 RepID=A0AAD8LCL8_TARER|nr:hypothetical protein QVD17_02970 [Tagetes erecta]